MYNYYVSKELVNTSGTIVISFYRYVVRADRIDGRRSGIYVKSFSSRSAANKFVARIENEK